MRAVVIGAGGHAKVILDILQCQREIEVAAFLDDDPQKLHRRFCGVPVIGPTGEIEGGQSGLGVEGIIVAIGNNAIRERFFTRARQLGFLVPCAIHPSAVLAKSVETGEGVVVMAGAVVNPGTRIGHNVCINTRASVDHDNFLDDHCHVFPGATLAGWVHVGRYSYIGSGAVVNPGLRVGINSMIGSGAVVTRNVPDNVIVVGVPAKIAREQEPLPAPSLVRDR